MDEEPENPYSSAGGSEAVQDDSVLFIEEYYRNEMRRETIAMLMAVVSGATLAQMILEHRDPTVQSGACIAMLGILCHLPYSLMVCFYGRKRRIGESFKRNEFARIERLIEMNQRTFAVVLALLLVGAILIAVGMKKHVLLIIVPVACIVSYVLHAKRTKNLMSQLRLSWPRTRENVRVN